MRSKTSAGRDCGYCRKPIRTPIAVLETRPGKLIKLDGTSLPFRYELLVCLACGQRIPLK